jgi:carbamoyltransferase
MIVLGVHGWTGTHDAAAALLINGQVVGMVEEERLSRIKHAPSATPRLAVHALLNAHQLAWDDVDVVAFGWNLPRYLQPGHSPLPANDRDILRQCFGSIGQRTPEVVWVDHHLAHAASGFFTSPFERAAVLVVDGQGEDRSISLYKGGPAGLVLLRDWKPYQSLGFMYEAATKYCGFGHLDAGKTMGLAAFDTPLDPFDLRWEADDIVSPVPPELGEDEVVSHWCKLLSDRFGPAQPPPLAFDPTLSRLRWCADTARQHRPEVAAAAQLTLESLMLRLVAYARAATGCGHVVLVGGVALNCVANGKILDTCDALYIPPVTHDAGCALGAAMTLVQPQVSQRSDLAALDLGLRYSVRAYEEAFERAGLRPRAVESPALEAAQRLEQGKIIAWFQGGGEPGPRALGRRSILADPRRDEQHERVNQLKSRENWRPLAPSVLEEDVAFLVGRPVNSPHMLQSFPLTDAARQQFPAITHVDGSARVQTVRTSANGEGPSPYAELLRLLKSRTGVGVVLNTSFNDAHEPLVQSPLDALRTFFSTPLESLVIGHWVLDKQL